MNGVSDGILSAVAASAWVPSDAPFTVDELLARPDAEATFARLSGAGDSGQVSLVGVLVLRVRAAAERAEARR